MTDNDALVKRLEAAANGLNLVPGPFEGPVQIANARLRDAINAIREAAAVIKGAEGWQIGGVAIVSDKSVPQNAYEIWHSDGRKERFYISDNGQPLPAAPKETE